MSAKSAGFHNKVTDSQDKLKEAEKDLKAVAKALQKAESDQKVVENSRTEAIRTLKNAELDAKELESQIAADLSAKVCFIAC